MHCMGVQQTLRKEIEESKRWLEVEKDDSTYKKDLKKRIQLINWVLVNMNNPDIFICEIIESKMNEIVLKINRTYSIFQSDKLHSELRILDWILFQVCRNKIKKEIGVVVIRKKIFIRFFLL
jgi:hypothetical protein